jgi:hypothetical protein
MSRKITQSFFPVRRQMFQRVALAVFIAVLVYGAVSWIQVRKEDFTNYKLSPQSYDHAESMRAPSPYPEREVSPGGPAAPAVRSTGAPSLTPAEQPNDPDAESYESSDIPERLRHPEKMFGPGVIGDVDTSTVQASGIASSAQQKVARAFTVFSPEYAQNGGQFMENGVTAFDSDIPSVYSDL